MHDNALFCASDDLLHAICTAAQRGVDVSIILREKMTDAGGLGQSRILTELLAAGVKIYRFEGGLLHTRERAGRWRTKSGWHR
ncbi:phospholipase D-like domain-containing protein [Escherichia coli]